MKTLLMALLLPLATVPAGAVDLGGLSDGPQTTFAGAKPGETVFVPGQGSGTLLDNGQVMGPLCPPDICPAPKTDPAASAFNAAATLPPDGTRWASPTCTRIPCALEPAPKEEAAGAAAAEGAKAGANIGAMTASSGKRNPGAGSANSTGPGERTVVTTPSGQWSCDNYSCRKVTDEERAEAAKKEQQIADQNRGFCPSGNCGSTNNTGAVAAKDAGGGEGRETGAYMGGLFASDDSDGLFGSGGGDDLGFDSGSSSPGGSSTGGDGNGGRRANAGAIAAGQSGDSKAIYKGEVTADMDEWKRKGLKSLQDGGTRAVGHLEKVAGLITGAETPDPNQDGLTPGCASGSSSGDMTSGVCVRTAKP